MASPQPPDVAELVSRVTRALDGLGIPFMLIGGQAVLLHGRVRLTEDIDITLGVAPDRLPALLQLCQDLDLATLPTDVPRFVRETFVLPVRDSASGIRVDFVFSTIPYERDAIARAERVEVGGTTVPFATAEDLILHKLFAGRAVDWEDAVSVVRRKGAALDWTYIEARAFEFTEVPGREDLPDQVARLRGEG
ncbi:MAG TPA: nucleotidyl transferase AbiEii/AbiGii toxin family protein [Gemmatimonadales bacterium]